MKNTKTIKAIALALLCTLLVGAAVGIGISAATEGTTTDVSIGMKNLAYNSKLNLAVQIKVQRARKAPPDLLFGRQTRQSSR